MASLYKRNGSPIWWVRFQLNGTRVQRSSGCFLAEAMEEERQRQEQGDKRVRFGVLCEEYSRQHLPLLKPGTRVGNLGHPGSKDKFRGGSLHQLAATFLPLCYLRLKVDRGA